MLYMEVDLRHVAGEDGALDALDTLWRKVGWPLLYKIMERLKAVLSGGAAIHFGNPDRLNCASLLPVSAEQSTLKPGDYFIYLGNHFRRCRGGGKRFDLIRTPASQLLDVLLEGIEYAPDVFIYPGRRRDLCAHTALSPTAVSAMDTPYTVTFPEITTSYSADLYPDGSENA